MTLWTRLKSIFWNWQPSEDNWIMKAIEESNVPMLYQVAYPNIPLIYRIILLLNVFSVIDYAMLVLRYFLGWERWPYSIYFKPKDSEIVDNSEYIRNHETIFHVMDNNVRYEETPSSILVVDEQDKLVPYEEYKANFRARHNN